MTIEPIYLLYAAVFVVTVGHYYSMFMVGYSLAKGRKLTLYVWLILAAFTGYLLAVTPVSPVSPVSPVAA